MLMTFCLRVATLLCCSKSVILHRLIQLSSSEFKLRYLGVVHYFLGIEVHPTTMGLMLCQHKYIIDILTRVGMTSCKPVDTPIFTSKVTILPDPLFSDLIQFRHKRSKWYKAIKRNLMLHTMM